MLVATVIPTGGMIPYAGATAPSGWLMCDGSAVSRTTYASLFSVSGVAYGAGDGVTTFNVPDRRDKVSVGVSGTKARGTTGGAETHTLTTAELAAHTHVQDAHTHTQNAHTHTQNAHTHTQNSHLHSYQRGRWTNAGDPGTTQGVWDLTKYDAQNTDGATATNQNTTAVNQNATAVNQNATSTNQNAGSGDAHSIMQPWGADNWIIKT